MALQHITDLLDVAATKYAAHGVSAYPLGDPNTCHRLTYVEICKSAQQNSELLRRMDGFAEGSVLLLHFDSHLDNIIWLWATLYAGCIPAMSTPFVRSEEHRKQHLLHPRELFDNAICLTRSTLRDQFPDDPILRLQEVDRFPTPPRSESDRVPRAKQQGLALLMLTSGSTGHAKAVCLTHKQILAALAGKSSFLPVENRFALLNWIRFDHVTSLVEIHLQTMFTGAEQIHLQPPDVISDPSLFLEMIHRHRVGKTFAPNFFLAKLRRWMESQATPREL